MISCQNWPPNLKVCRPCVQADRIFELPDMVVEALGAFLSSKVSERRVGEIYSQESIEACRVAVPDAKSVAELADARIPAIAGIECDVAPAHAEVVHKVAANRARPVSNSVPDGRSRRRSWTTVPESLWMDCSGRPW